MDVSAPDGGVCDVRRMSGIDPVVAVRSAFVADRNLQLTQPSPEYVHDVLVLPLLLMSNLAIAALAADFLSISSATTPSNNSNPASSTSVDVIPEWLA